MFSIYNDRLLAQGIIHLLSGERRGVACVVFHDFSPYTPMVIMVRVQNYVCRLPVHMLRVQGSVGIAATC